MMAYDKRVDDYNFGTILRTSPKVEYEEHTTIFGTIHHMLIFKLYPTAAFDVQHHRNTWSFVLTSRFAVPRMQFYAVEIARNRHGLNDWIYEKEQAEKGSK